MQDDKTTQSDTKDSGNDDKKDLTHESTLSLGANPSDQSIQPDSSAPAASADSSDDSSTASPTTPADPPADDSSVQDNQAESTGTDQVAGSSQSGDLQSIRNQALKELTPIVGELDQEPAEKFRTLMMLIQSSDDQKLIKEAYDTAEKITDNKTKAEALLAIVDEINYFTAKDEKSED